MKPTVEVWLAADRLLRKARHRLLTVCDDADMQLCHYLEHRNRLRLKIRGEGGFFEQYEVLDSQTQEAPS